MSKDVSKTNKGLLPEIMRTKGEVASFGGNTLAVNMEKANTAIAKMEYTERIWDRSRSQFVLKNLVHSFPSDWKNLRQISAEMQRKRDALREAKYSYTKKLQEAEIKKCDIEILEEQLTEDKSQGERNKIHAQINMLQLEISEIESGAEASVPKIEGALKEVLTLEKMHDTLTKRIADTEGIKVDELTEEVFEKHEARSHIKYALIQAIREVRATGRINTGVQEYMEQCGINITHAMKDILTFLKSEGEVDDESTKLLYKFLDMMAKKYEKCADVQAELTGFDAGFDKQIAYNKERDKR